MQTSIYCAPFETYFAVWGLYVERAALLVAGIDEFDTVRQETTLLMFGGDLTLVSEQWRYERAIRLWRRLVNGFINSKSFLSKFPTVPHLDQEIESVRECVGLLRSCVADMSGRIETLRSSVPRLNVLSRGDLVRLVAWGAGEGRQKEEQEVEGEGQGTERCLRKRWHAFSDALSNMYAGVVAVIEETPVIRDKGGDSQVTAKGLDDEMLTFKVPTLVYPSTIDDDAAEMKIDVLGRWIRAFGERFKQALGSLFFQKDASPGQILQVALILNEISFTQNAERAIAEGRRGVRGLLSLATKKVKALIEERYKGKRVQKRLEALVLQAIQMRTVSLALERTKVQSAKEFTWQCQVRHYLVRSEVRMEISSFG